MAEAVENVAPVKMEEEVPKQRSSVGWAPIKAEFLAKTGPKLESKPEEAETEPSASVSLANEEAAGAEAGDGGGDRKRMRGQNKERPKLRKPRGQQCLCFSLLPPLPPEADGSQATKPPCRFGDDCHSSHDPRAFWDAKAEDIADACPIYDVRGWCRFGLNCRLAKAHTDKDTLAQSLDTAKWALWKEKVAGRDPRLASDELNFIPMDLIRRIRKQEYDFSDCNAYLAEKGLKAPRAKKPRKGPKAGEGAGDEAEARPTPRERTPIQWAGKKYLAPLTTVGNLPFRRLCVQMGADVTCGEMALATSFLQGSAAEWSLVRRHESEKLFGVQLAGGHPDSLSYAAKLVAENTDVDFVDLNLGCPIDLICDKGAGCSLASKTNRLCQVIGAMSNVLTPRGIPLTLKFRTGLRLGEHTAGDLIAAVKKSGVPVDLLTLHGRSKEQRYSKLADWPYIRKCASEAAPIPFFGGGDVLSFEDYEECLQGGVAGIMLGRGALIKPWLFTEIEERRHWDISAEERLDLLRRFANFGLEHWGCDQEGVEKTRRFLLEWLSFTHRYIPVGLLERLPQRINEKPPHWVGRSDLETLMGSPAASDWVKLSVLLLGPTPPDFAFLPKHKASAY